MSKNYILESKILVAEFQSKLDSMLAYLAVVADDQINVKMLAWSFCSMLQCQMEIKPIDYKINETGLWGDSFRERRVIECFLLFNA
mgnify:CR=1 FL=1